MRDICCEVQIFKWSIWSLKLIETKSNIYNMHIITDQNNNSLSINIIIVVRKDSTIMKRPPL